MSFWFEVNNDDDAAGTNHDSTEMENIPSWQ